MIQYILETLAFQLLFLAVYDLFLKKETFFQWNRVYLLGTLILSLTLPWIKIEALKTTVSADTTFYPSFLFQLDTIVVAANAREANFWERFAIHEWVYLVGALVTLIVFGYKLFKLYALKENSATTYYPEFTKITIRESKVAFSFFKNVFLGDEIPEAKETQILAHELVHVRHWHSMDLLFFELMRIAFWFNPMIYVYQNRIAELHEFIADASLAKKDKKEQYQLLLSEAFQTQKLSFVNQFFKQSLIKKRIVMMTKEKSNSIVHLKYLILVPIITVMLVYSSCEQKSNEEVKTRQEASLTEAIALLNEQIAAKDSLTKEEREQIRQMAESVTLMHNKSINENDKWSTGIDAAAVPFAVIEEVPIFPGCENASDKKACFIENIQEHVRKNFNYPKEALDQGIQGKVALLFTIDTDGSITNIQKRGTHELLENEAERIIKKLPKMQPGKQRGAAVKVPFSIPITFKLN